MRDFLKGIFDGVWICLVMLTILVGVGVTIAGQMGEFSEGMYFPIGGVILGWTVFGLVDRYADPWERH